jgi:hypothetical protein
MAEEKAAKCESSANESAAVGSPFCDRREAPAFATIVLAGLRGFMLDFCATHDRKRLDHAVGLWLRTLNTLLPTHNESSRLLGYDT